VAPCTVEWSCREPSRRFTCTCYLNVVDTLVERKVLYNFHRSLHLAPLLVWFFVDVQQVAPVFIVSIYRHRWFGHMARFVLIHVSCSVWLTDLRHVDCTIMHLWSCTSIHFRLIRPVSKVLCSEFLRCRVIYQAKVKLQITLFDHLWVLDIFVNSTRVLVLKVLEELFSVFLLNLLEVFLREASNWLWG
jgi:hypothetical protein